MGIVAIMLLGAALAGLLAPSRGRNSIVWALVGAFFPLISLLVILLLPDLKETSSVTAQLAEAEHQGRVAELRTKRPVVQETKTCPRCGEIMHRDAEVCPMCGYEFEEAQTAA